MVARLLSRIRSKSLTQVFDFWCDRIVKLGKLCDNSVYRYGSSVFQNFVQDIDQLIFVLQLLGLREQCNTVDFLKVVWTTNDADALLNQFKFVTDELKKNDEYVALLLAKLSDEQINRLDQAIHCLQEGCYDASVVMAVSAVEYNLVRLMEGDEALNKAFYEKDRGKMTTFGNLINFFSEIVKEQQFSSLEWISELNPLLHLCNRYRIFSAHPKGKTISFRVAQSVLNLSFEFIIENISQDIKRGL